VLPSITPAKLARALELFDDPAWLFELKHDGFRSLVRSSYRRCWGFTAPFWRLKSVSLIRSRGSRIGR
jgi:hypothetical protein